MKVNRADHVTPRFAKPLTAIVAIALIFATALSCANAQTSNPASPAGADTPALAFDVVSIKSDNAADWETHMQALPDGIRLVNVSLEDFIRQAYGLDFHGQLFAAPDWAASQHYDVEAKVAGTDVAAFHKLTQAQVRLMARPILIDRFKLAAHSEMRALPVYFLEVTKGGSKLKPATPGDTYPNGRKGPNGAGATNMVAMHRVETDSQQTVMEMTAQAISIARLVATLAQLGQDRPILDRTGLTGVYDLKLNWATEATAASKGSPADDIPPSVFTAIQEQLGLKLEPAKEPVPVLVVDHIERPSEN